MGIRPPGNNGRGRESSPRPYPALDVATPFPSLPPQPRRSLPGVRARQPVCTCRGTGFVSAQRETSARRRYLTPFSRETGRWAPADPVRPSSLGLGLAAQVAPRAARHLTRPPVAVRTYSPDTPSHVFRGQGQATVGRQKVMRRGHPQKPGEGRESGRGAAREGPLPAHAGSKPRPHGRAPLSPPPAPNPIRGWHRLSNRLTNPAPPIAGRVGRGLRDQARVRGPSSKSLKVLQAKSSSALCRGSGASWGLKGA